MAEKKNKSLREFSSFDELIDKRQEALGGDGTTFPIEGFGKTWHLAAPDLQNAEWNDAFSDLHTDLSGGLITTRQYRDELLELVLGDQADDFRSECEKAKGGRGVDPSQMLNMALEEYTQDRRENPTQPNSRSTRRRAKRR